ncbi:MAG: hypothetical protein AAFY48_24950, partial [Bacteroidota bacterium]
HSYPFILIVGDGGFTYSRKALRSASALVASEGITNNKNKGIGMVKTMKPSAEWVCLLSYVQMSG